MTDWDARQYLEFRADRLRPGLDLLDRVGRLEGFSPALVVDLGCGTGALTGQLARRWGGARVLAVDRSAAMLDRARGDGADPRVSFVEADLLAWQPPAPPDLVYSNAVLHWLPDRGAALARICSWLPAGGVLAVQLPRNFEEPTHQVAYELARTPPWDAHLWRVLAERADAEEPHALHDLLAPMLGDVDVWETTYLHVLRGPDPVVRWARGSLLRPFLSALPPEEVEAFLAAYRDGVRSAYPPRADATTLLPYRRVFGVGRRA